ncbi:hypothetical protein ACSMXM_05355 [Pacificimonas sp. ICDLI1SI03]
MMDRLQPLLDELDHHLLEQSADLREVDLRGRQAVYRQDQINELRNRIVAAVKAAPTPEPLPEPLPIPAPEPAPTPVMEAEGFWNETLSRDFRDASLRLPWGDTRFGAKLGSAEFRDIDKQRAITIELDPELLTGKRADFALDAPGTNSFLQTRESALPPVLTVIRPDGERMEYKPTRDGYFDSSTAKSLGENETMRAYAAMIAFDEYEPGPVQSATLTVWSAEKQYNSTTLAVHLTDTTPRTIAADIPISSEPIRELVAGEIITLDEFHMLDQETGIVHGIVPMGEEKVMAGPLVDLGDQESDTFYLSYFARFDKSWRPTMGGKLWGLTNTHNYSPSSPIPHSPNGPGGWGGRNPDGDSSSFRLNFDEYNPGPLADTHLSLASYGYYIDRGTTHGQTTPGTIPMAKDRFGLIEQVVGLNTVYPDGTCEADGYHGILLDGVPIVWQTGLKIRDYGMMKDKVSFEDFLYFSRYRTFWPDVYFGGVGYRQMQHETHLMSIGPRVILGDKGFPPRDEMMAELARLNAVKIDGQALIKALEG